eukprot:737629-Prymnesium_polylepis.1
MSSGLEGQIVQQKPRPWPCFNGRGDAQLPFRKHEPFCPAWPPYSAATAGRLHFIEQGARRTVDEARVQAPKVTSAFLERLMSRKCLQRLCLHVQVLRGRVFVVAPRSSRCSRSADSVCTIANRQRTEGVAMSVGLEHGKWAATYSPTSLEWHFAAGLN